MPDKDVDSIEAWHRMRAMQIHIDFIEEFAPRRGQLLDIGCATGDFLHAAQERKWRVVGIEINKEAARVAREQYGLEVTTGSLESFIIPSHTFDVITLWDVLEHLPSPSVTLSRCYDLLDEDGILVFTIPNLDSFDRYLFGRAWIGWDAPRHFHLFTDDTLALLLFKQGYRILGKRCLLGGKGAFFLSLDTLLGESRTADAIRRLYPFISLILWPYRQVSYLLHRGPVITYVTQKIY